MTRIYLMDLNGLPRLLLNQPATVNNPSEHFGWMSVFSAVCSLPEGKEVAVKFKTEHGRMATARLTNKDNHIDLLPNGDVNLYMYAIDIIPDDIYRKL